MVAGKPNSDYYESNPLSKRWRRNLSRMVLKLMPTGWESMRHLDVGVGDGYTIRLLKPTGEVVGIDTDPAMMEGATRRGVEFKSASAYRIPFPDASFDIVTCIEVIEHLEQPYEAVKELGRVLRPGGYVVITSPVPNAAWRLLWWAWTTLGPGKRWRDTPHVADLDVWKGSTGSPGLEEMFRSVGLSIEDMRKCNAGFVAGARALKSPRQ